MLAVVRIDAEQAGHWPADLYPEQTPPGSEARFDGQHRCWASMCTPMAATSGSYWHADVDTNRDLTSFVHLLGEDGQLLGQIDKTPGDGTYHTQHWTPGDHVIQRYRPELLDACASSATVQIVTGWYGHAAGNTRIARVRMPKATTP